ncbi:restriction endonuclease subunit S, partial [Heyndrickxia coagulans]|uniref:restriction endonuclease subunit S n=2 Tax=Heyndrickxia coagulans TaxID=1398 RepID=UPI002E1DF629
RHGCEQDGNHGNLHPTSQDYVEKGIPFLLASDVENDRIDLNNCKFISQETSKKLQKGFAKEGDVLLTHKGSVGNSAIVPKISTEYVVLTPQVTYYRIKNKERLNNHFLKNIFQSNYFQKQLKIVGKGATRDYIGIVAQRQLKVILPKNIEEQQKIASILSTWDKAIELKEKLIEQKKQQKKGLMQKLLTGEVRLPGFEEEWEEVKLGELGDFKTSSVDKKVNKNDIEILLVNYMDVYRNRLIDNTIDFMKVTATKKQIETFNVQYGDVLFTPSSETPDDIGHSAVVKVDSAKILYSYHLVRLRFKREMDVDFKAYVFNSSNLLREFSKRATGATRYTLSLSDFKESTIRIPKDITEQKAIGTVLLNSEREIRLLKKELEMLKQQKKGLMQLLLTGKVRVKV